MKPVSLPSLAFLVLLLASGAIETVGQPFIRRHTIDAGGGSSQGGSTQIKGTVGQSDAGRLSGGGYELRGGFWIGASQDESATATPTPPPPSATSTPTATITPNSATTTATPSLTPSGLYLDVKPDPLDDFIDARDLIEWVSRMKAPENGPNVLFEFSNYWKESYPPASKDVSSED